VAGETDKGSISITVTAWVIAVVAICAATGFTHFYHEREFWLAFIVGLHNTLFDVLFIGVLIFWLNKRVEYRIEIRRYREELSVWNAQGTKEAHRRLQLFILKLNELGAFDLSLRASSMAGIDLTGLKLFGSDLSNSNLYQAILNGADLRKTHLDGAHLKEANLTNADLRHASLRAANLDYADLRESRLEGADFTDAKIPNVRWEGATWDDNTKLSLSESVKRKMIYSPRSNSGLFRRVTPNLKGSKKSR
jgi:Pentapeptide repeats (8 copies)